MNEPAERQRRAVENLAAALNECFDAVVEKSTQAAERNRREVNARLDKQDETLRRQNDSLQMIWTQCGGQTTRRLPIDA